MYSIDSFDSPVDTFDRRKFSVWPCDAHFVEAGAEAGIEAGIEAGATVLNCLLIKLDLKFIINCA